MVCFSFYPTLNTMIITVKKGFTLYIFFENLSYFPRKNITFVVAECTTDCKDRQDVYI